MSKRVEWDGKSNVKYMCEQVKREIADSAREVCDSVRVGGKNQESVWWTDEVKAATEKKKV